MRKSTVEEKPGATAGSKRSATSRDELTPMTADVKDGVEFFGAANETGEFLCMLPEALLMFKKLRGDGVTLVYGGGIQRSSPTVWRGDGDVRVRGKHIVGMRKLRL